MMGPFYLISYGMARSLGRFEWPEAPLARGQVVVIRTHRGTELGAVLAEALASPGPGAKDAPILRVATAADLERARAAGLERDAHFEACRAVFEGGTWPLELIDAEPLLDPGRTVLHYLGPHQLDASGLVAAFRERCGLQVVLEPVGRDVEERTEPEAAPGGCGSCGSDGGCSSGDCSSGGGCAVKSMVAARRRVAVDA